MATALEPKRIAEAEKQGSDRSFGYVFAVVFALIGLFPLWRLEAPRWWSLAIAVGFAVIAAVYPGVLGPLNRLWLAFGKLLHRIVSPLVMGAVYFLAVTPTGLLMRLRGRSAVAAAAAGFVDVLDRARSRDAAAVRDHEEAVLAQEPPMAFLLEIIDFLRTRKKYWLAPIIIVLLLFGGLIVLTQGSAVAPFIYTLF